MKRVMLCIVTNLAVILVLSVVLRVLGVDRILNEQGIGLDMGNLLVFAAVFGFGGRSFPWPFPNGPPNG
jgi:heat shock protein HtpX